jgi:hypothetical protein
VNMVTSLEVPYHVKNSFYWMSDQLINEDSVPWSQSVIWKLFTKFVQIYSRIPYLDKITDDSVLTTWII